MSGPTLRLAPGGFVFSRRTMKIHMYEFRAEKKKLKCSCGWERTLKTADAKVVAKAFSDHQTDAAAKTL